MKSTVSFKLLLLFIFSGTRFFHVHAEAPAVERQVMVVIGETAVLPCLATTEDSVDWYYHGSPFDAQSYFIYSNQLIYEGISTRFMVPRPKPNDYTLKISNSNVNDSGLYTCTESGGNGRRHTIPLLVVSAEEMVTSSSIAAVVALGIISAILAIVVVILAFKLVSQRRKRKPETTNTDEIGHLIPQGKQPVPVVVPLAVIPQPDPVLPTGVNPPPKRNIVPVPPVVNARPDPVPVVEPPPYVSPPPEPGPLAFILDDNQEDTGGQQVRGVCYFGGLLYVIRSPDAKVEIYDPRTMKRVKIMDVGDPYPGCMALCPTNKCFYITYFKSQTILKAKLDGTHGKRWSVADAGKPDGVSVVAKSVNIVVAFRDSTKPTLQVFNPEGEVLQTITMDAKVAQPRYAASYQNDKFLVCYGVTGNTECGVCLVDCAGTLLQTIETQTKHPLHLAIHKSGFVLVPDFNVNNVVLLNDRLQYSREAISISDGLASPFKLCFDDECKRLFVGEFAGDGRVLAYDVIYG